MRAPLLFFPVRLEVQSNHWYLQPRPDAGITFNKSFLLAYAYYNKVALDESLLDLSFDDLSNDSTVFRTEIYQLLKDKIEINFNPDIFRDELTAFESFKKDDFDAAHKNGEIKLYPEASLGIFPQASSHLVPDYVQLIEEDTIQDIEQFFMHRSASHDGATAPADAAPQVIREERVFTPFKLDAYQEQAIRAVKSGHSIVVQGPPGTGKSQLVANLMADAMAAGKRVLLVCQKRAALDVVYSRLKEIELGDFLGLVHDFRNDRRQIFDKIARQIDLIEDYKARNRSIDSIQTERRFFAVCRTIDQLVEELDEFRHQLFDDKECGISAKELYLTSDPYRDAVNIKQEYQYLTFDKLSEFARKLKSFANYAQIFDADSYPWRDRRSFAELTLQDQKIIVDVLNEIPAFLENVKATLALHLPLELTLEDAESLIAREEEMLGLITLLQDETTYLYFQNMVDERDSETSMLWLANTERVILNCFKGSGPEPTLPSDQLGKFQEALQARMTARRSFVSRIRWEFFSPHRFWVKRVLVANGFAYNKIGLGLLEERIDNRLNLEHHLTALRQKPWLENIPVDSSEESIRMWFEKQKFALRAKLIFGTLREVKDTINAHRMSREEFVGVLKIILIALESLPERRKRWLQWLTPYQVRHLSQAPDLLSSFQNSLKRDFDSLCEFDRLKNGLSNSELSILNKLNDHVGSWQYHLLEPLFQNSLRLAWIDHLETKYPILRSVSSLKMEEMQSSLQQLVKEKRKLCKQILLQRARETVYDQLEYNRLQNRVTYRDLYHQVSKKKRIWPLRRLIHEYEDELFRLIPCWLASPESVSAVFQMKETFDLVIFDEASQCFSERGIPAMYRGRQLLIAGDSMQLKPNELYQIRWEDDREDPDLEQNSLLELGSRYLKTVHLQGHYRSLSPELIDFSNRYFYGGRLRLLPDREYLNKTRPALEYRKVEGVWENQTNRTEAETIASS
ncbi:MAG: DNA helicase I [Bacteroidia bacterium]|nr:DNA helicase I [Bacteroidia bacterium]